MTKKTRKREFLVEMDRVVPWSALVQFHDPSVGFGLSFEAPDPAAAPAPAAPRLGSVKAKPPAAAPAPILAPAKSKPESAAKRPDAGTAAGAGAKKPEGGGAVVSIDAFRKKTD